MIPAHLMQRYEGAAQGVEALTARMDAIERELAQMRVRLDAARPPSSYDLSRARSAVPPAILRQLRLVVSRKSWGPWRGATQDDAGVVGG